MVYFGWKFSFYPKIEFQISIHIYCKKGYIARLEEQDEEYSDEIDELLEDCDSFREAYDLGVLQGLDEGYNNCLEEQSCREDCLVEPEYDTEFLAYIKELQDRVSRLHKYSDNNGFKQEIYDIFHLITVITEHQVMQPVYKYWVDLEDN